MLSLVLALAAAQLDVSAADGGTAEPANAAPFAPAPPPVSAPPHFVRGALYTASVFGFSLVSGALVTWLATRPQAALIDGPGRPVPIVTAFGMTGAAALNFGAMHAVVPYLAGIGNAPGTVTDFSAAREQAWRLGRYGLIPTAVSLVVCFVGFGLEHAEFGRGQGVALVGMSMLLASTMALDVLEAIGAWLGANAARRSSP